MPIKEIIFDFDGTIADSLETTREVLNSFGGDYGLPVISKEKATELMDYGAREALRMYKIHLWQVPKLAKKIKIKLRDRIEEIEPFLKVIDIVRKLKANGVTVGILTSNSAANVDWYLRSKKIDVFDYVVSAKSIFGKHRAIKKLLKRRELGTDEIVYVGDEVRDVISCKKIGVKVAGVTWGFNSKKAIKKAEPDWVVDNPSELDEILEKEIRNGSY
ncbi:MAG TPA: HAD-IA family hydrolase [Patescibacteria group bacterium]